MAAPLDLDQEARARGGADYAPSPIDPSPRELATMKSLALRCVFLATLLVAGVTLTGCAGTRDNAQQQADAAPAHQVDMNTPF